MHMARKLLGALLILVYVGLALFGFTHPMADLLAGAMIWLGLIISLSAVVCPVAALLLKKKSWVRVLLLAAPFFLLAVQLVLCAAVDML